MGTVTRLRRLDGQSRMSLSPFFVDVTPCLGGLRLK